MDYKISDLPDFKGKKVLEEASALGIAALEDSGLDCHAVLIVGLCIIIEKLRTVDPTKWCQTSVNYRLKRLKDDVSN